MDIQGISMAMAQNKVATEASVSMLAKSLDNQEQSGENLTKMLEESVTPNLGRNLDVRI